MAVRKSEKNHAPEFSKNLVSDSALRRPEVIVEFIFDRGLLFVAVRNIGDRPATKISITFDKKIKGLNGTRNFSSLPLFTNLQFLGPQREIVTLLDACASYFKRKEPTKVSAKICYRDPENQKYEATINHDLGIYREIVYLNPPASDKAEAAEV